MAHKRFPIDWRPRLRWTLSYSAEAPVLPLLQTLKEFLASLACALSGQLDHPATGKGMKWESPLPEDFVWLLTLLRQDREAFGRLSIALAIPC